MHELTLDSRYAQIKKIHSFANCDSPLGKYTTDLLSYADGTFYFTQVTDATKPAFRVKINEEHQALLIDEKENIVDTLSIEASMMIRGHDFHMIQTNPSHVFKDIQFVEKEENHMERYVGMDKLENEVKLFYDSKEEQLSKIELINPVDTMQIIEIVHKKWIDTDFGKMAKEIEIIQGGMDTFFFDFEFIRINEDLN